MKSFQEYLALAARDHIAIGHFNVSTLDGIWAVADAAQALKVPVIIGVSEGERDYVGVRQAVAIVESIRKERNQPIFVNADHTYSFERVKEAILAGFDSVIFDGAKLSLEENIQVTKKCVAFAREHKSASGNPILIEGELGYIGSSSKVLDAIPEGAAVGDAAMTKPEDAARFVTETGIDLLAPAIGNIHGVIRGGDPALNTIRAKEIRDAIAVPLVLHGASGNTASDIDKTIKAGAVIVHVNTELRIAYRSALIKTLSDDHEEVSPYKYLKPAKQAMQKVIEEKIRIFSREVKE
jgi:fructose-bisphosphate aldolase class II